MAKKNISLITDHKLLIWLSQVPERLRWVGTAGVLLFVILLWGSFFYLPTVWRMRKDKTQIMSNQAICQTLLRESARGKKMKKENEEMQVVLDSATAPDNYQIADDIVTLAHKSGVVVSSIAPIKHSKSGVHPQAPAGWRRGAAPVGDPEREKLQYDIGINGGFGSILDFLHELEQLSVVSDVKHFVCHRQQHSQSGRHDATLRVPAGARQPENTGGLEAQLTVEVSL